MDKPIIEIKEASEEWKEGLVMMGFLERIGNEYRCKENSPAQPPTKANVQD